MKLSQVPGLMPEKKLMRIVKSFRHGILGRRDSDFMCYAVSAPLHSYLKHDYSLETRLVSGYCKIGAFEPEHFWLELPDKRIIDPTRDQFGYEEKVYIGIKPDNYFEITTASLPRLLRGRKA